MNELNNKLLNFFNDYDLNKFKAFVLDNDINDYEDIEQWMVEDLMDINFSTPKEFRKVKNTIIRHYGNLAEA